MTIQATLNQRAGGKCELCTGESDLGVHDVRPNDGPSAETAVLVCASCREQLADPAALATANAKSWYGLTDSMWSEHAAVKVLTYRILKAMSQNPWAQDLLGQMYLDDDQQRWADAGDDGSDAAAADDDDIVRDANGMPLSEGDIVTLIKDLDVKGANFTAKRGTVVKGIALTGDPKYVEGRVNGIRIVLVAAYLKKA